MLCEDSQLPWWLGLRLLNQRYQPQKKEEQDPSELLWLTSRLEPNGEVFVIHPLSIPHGVLVAIGSIRAGSLRAPP
jgi:hypothetical protein